MTSGCSKGQCQMRMAIFPFTALSVAFVCCCRGHVMLASDFAVLVVCPVRAHARPRTRDANGRGGVNACGR